ncbi:MAG: DUF1566 domain-containing protein [Oleispira sp.]|nr:DUF1566 domain-containing protein [Oleispira sp.]
MNKFHVIMMGMNLCLFTVMAQSECYSSITATTPDSVYTDNGDSTVTNNVTGLMWAQCLDGLSGIGCATGTASSSNWQAALILAEASTLAGHDDWRLPSLKELASIVEASCLNPSVNSTYFPNTYVNPLTQWTSTYVSSTDKAWVIIFNYGNDNSYAKDFPLGIRLVRGE